MTDKQQIEEMAKILANHRGFGCDNEDCCDMSCQVYKVGCLPYEFAEVLYNAGYRKQSEWISVDERLPDESGEYLAYTNRGNCSTLSYSARHKMFNAFDCLSKKFAKGYHIDVTHWMPIPEAPKGGVYNV